MFKLINKRVKYSVSVNFVTNRKWNNEVIISDNVFGFLHFFVTLRPPHGLIFKDRAL